MAPLLGPRRPARGARRKPFPLHVEAIERRLPPATFVVTSTGDSGPGTLRQAILDANAAAAPNDTIDFTIGPGGVQTIAPLSPLPAITAPVTIDGTSQPG